MKIISRLWLNASSIFDTVQYFFNRDFWGDFKKKFGDFSGQAVLDIACGTGKMREVVNSGYYLGIDINQQYIDQAKKNYSDKQETYFFISDAVEYQPDRQFDTVFLVGSAHHLSDEQVRKICQTVREIKPKQFIMIDGIPQGYLSGFLKWLDKILGGGEYFRTEDELRDLIKDYFPVPEVGKMYVKGSFYYYPYVVASWLTSTGSTEIKVP